MTADELDIFLLKHWSIILPCLYVVAAGLVIWIILSVLEHIKLRKEIRAAKEQHLEEETYRF